LTKKRGTNIIVLGGGGKIRGVVYQSDSDLVAGNAVLIKNTGAKKNEKGKGLDVALDRGGKTKQVVGGGTVNLQWKGRPQ